MPQPGRKKDKVIVEQNCLNQQIVGYCSQEVAPIGAPNDKGAL